MRCLFYYSNEYTIYCEYVIWQDEGKPGYTNIPRYEKNQAWENMIWEKQGYVRDSIKSGSNYCRKPGYEENGKGRSTCIWCQINFCIISLNLKWNVLYKKIKVNPLIKNLTENKNLTLNIE